MWSLLYLIWLAFEQAIGSVLSPVPAESEWQQEVEQLSLAEYLLLFVVISPIKEELLFRGALFAALMRRWGLVIAIIAPSILWALLHFQYEPWKIASIAVSGALLAIIRWRGESLYLPIGLHAVGNLFA